MLCPIWWINMMPSIIFTIFATELFVLLCFLRKGLIYDDLQLDPIRGGKMITLKNRFSRVTVLNEDTRILGANASEWDKALTGNMGETLQEVRRRATSGVKRDVTQATSLDVASFVGKRLRSR